MLIEINLDATGKEVCRISKMFETVREEVIHARMDKDEDNYPPMSGANAGKN